MSDNLIMLNDCLLALAKLKNFLNQNKFANFVKL